MAIDPVCEMTVEPDKAAAKAEYQGVTYYFCSDGCHKAFTVAPQNYTQKIGSGKPNAGEKAHSTRR